ncbi:Hypothetical predicted protein [Paramuricea clavata]|uniref:Uncharacterized protein n=1 Tax=Paramuricea clavata TaxID=317549 RepID=A0A6S7JEA1_PARCT|nr:Hypothetical predicted protein [Paramuricea clavata]
MATKRLFELSTGDSPGKPKPKLALRESSSRKSLFQTISQSSVSAGMKNQCHGLNKKLNPSPKNLGEECGTLSDAEKDFEIDYVHDSVGSAIPVPSSPAAVFNFSDNLSPIFKESPCKGSAGNNPGTLGDIVQNLITAFKSVACPKD